MNYDDTQYTAMLSFFAVMDRHISILIVCSMSRQRYSKEGYSVDSMLHGIPA